MVPIGAWIWRKQKILDAIIMKNFEIIKFRKKSEFPVYVLAIMVKSSHLTCFCWKVGACVYENVFKPFMHNVVKWPNIL